MSATEAALLSRPATIQAQSGASKDRIRPPCPTCAVATPTAGHHKRREVTQVPGIVALVACVIVAVAGLALIASPAHANFGIVPGSVETVAENGDGSRDFQAASHPFLYRVSFAMNKNAKDEVTGQLRDVKVDLPPGVIGDPLATPRCSQAQFEGQFPRCPGNTQIGTEHTQVEGLSISGPVYNLQPPPGVPAELAFGAVGFNALEQGSVLTGEKYNLSVTANDIPKPGPIVSVSETIWGVPADPAHDPERTCFDTEGNTIHGCKSDAGLKPFMTLPTSCQGPLITTIKVDSEEEPGLYESEDGTMRDSSGEPSGLFGCERVPFSPRLSVTPDSTETEAPSGLSVDLEMPQPQNAAGLAEANLKEVTVTLPAGMTVSPAAATGLGACSLAQLGLDNGDPATCPESSKIGSVVITTPLLETPLEGSVFLAEQGDLPGNGTNPFGSLLALYVVAEGRGVVIKIPGEISLDTNTGQLTARFGRDPVTSIATGEEQFLPQLPFSDLKMEFAGGPRAPLITPATCGMYGVQAELTPWSGGPDVSRTSMFTINQGCNPDGFAPSFTAGTSLNRAGTFSPFTLTFARQDREQRLSDVDVETPKGLLGVLRNVAQCGEAQAADGTCEPASLVGEASVAVGPGPEPYWTRNGKVFLTGPYRGAPFGLSIMVPAVAGPFNLGSEGKPVVVRTRLSVDPNTAQIVASSDPLPTMLKGVPLDIRTVNVTLNRQDFIVNPTSCAPMSVSGVLSSVTGADVSISTPFQATNCANLPFRPTLKASTAGKTSKALGAALNVQIGQKHGEADIGKVDVALPAALPARLTTLQKACADRQFAVNPAGCPEGADIGVATVETPILTSKLRGPAYLVSHGGAAFPDVVVVLQGEGITIELTGSTDIKRGITRSRFDTLPDAPISSFSLSLPQGGHSVLAANANLCAPVKVITKRERVARYRHGRKRLVTRSVRRRVPRRS